MLNRTSVQRPTNVNDKKSFWNVETEEWVFKYKGFPYNTCCWFNVLTSG